MKHKILVIDDEAEIRKTIRLQLEGTIRAYPVNADTHFM